MKIVEVKAHPLLTLFRGPVITRAQRAPLVPTQRHFHRPVNFLGDFPANFDHQIRFTNDPVKKRTLEDSNSDILIAFTSIFAVKNTTK